MVIKIVDVKKGQEEKQYVIKEEVSTEKGKKERKRNKKIRIQGIKLEVRER